MDSKSTAVTESLANPKPRPLQVPLKGEDDRA